MSNNAFSRMQNSNFYTVFVTDDKSMGQLSANAVEEGWRRAGHFPLNTAYCTGYLFYTLDNCRRLDDHALLRY